VIAVDTSALIAIVLREPQAAACEAALEANTELLISAGTVAEALIVASRRNVSEEMQRLIDIFSFTVVPITGAAARRVAAAYDRWGRGVHAAALNVGDCFSYEVAKANDCPLLFVGADFAQTDIGSAF
jgi:ribonuclease VapC